MARQVSPPVDPQNILSEAPVEGVEDTKLPPRLSDKMAQVELLSQNLEGLHKEMEQRYDSRIIVSKDVKPWMVSKGSTSSKPKIWIPLKTSNSNLECLLAELVFSIGTKDLDFEIIEKEVSIDLTLDKQVESSLIGIWAAVSGKREVGPDTSFPTAGHPVDLGYTAALAESASCYVDEPHAGRGFFKQLIPEKFIGSAGSKRYLSDIIGKIRTACTKEEHSEVPETLHWLIHRWAFTHRGDIGATVLRNQKIKWDSVKRKALPYTIEKRKVKGKTVESLRYSVPKNIGDSPLLAPLEKQLFKRMAQILYFGILDKLEHRWKGLTGPEQHDSFTDLVKKLTKLHDNYSKSADKLCARVYKRKKLYEKALGKPEPKSTKKKKVTATMVARHMVELSSEMAKDPKAQARVPFVYNTKLLLRGTDFESTFDEIFSQDRDILDMAEYCDIDTDKLLQTVSLFEDSYEGLCRKHGSDKINSIVVSNGFDALMEEEQEEDEEDTSADPDISEPSPADLPAEEETENETG
jgi:hypothetical protein